jgi:hypothetical protein
VETEVAPDRGPVLRSVLDPVLDLPARVLVPAPPVQPLARLPVLPPAPLEFLPQADLVLGLVAHPLLDRVPDLGYWTAGPSTDQAGPSPIPAAQFCPSPARVSAECWTQWCS